jgi:xanthine dehydrogenase YagS FAD-binding subunit
LADLANNADINSNFPALVTAVKNIGSPQIINAGTVGGDLCQRPRCWYLRNGYGSLAMEENAALVRGGDNRYHAIFGNDGPAVFVSPSSLGPALIALDATLTAVGSNGKKREIAAREFFRTPKSETERETALKPNEILTEINVPVTGLKNATYEVRHRHGFDWPYVTATVAFQLKDRTASDSRVVLGHVAPVPWPTAQAARLLDGSRIDAALAEKCGQAATNGAKPLSGNAYKLQLVKTAVKRAALAATGG